MRRETQQTETRGHYTNNGVVFAIQPDGVANERSIGSEAALPDLVAENDDMIPAGLVFAGFEGATELRRDTQHAEIVGRDGCGAERLRLALRGETDGAIFIRGGHVCENVVCVAPGEIIGDGDRICVGVESRRRVDGTNHRKALGVATRRTPQQESAHHTKHGGVHGNAESQRDHCRGSEARILDQHTNAETQILEQRFQHGQPPALAIIFFCLFQTAEFYQGVSPRFFGVHSRAQIVLDVQLKMAFHLGGKLAVAAVLVEETTQPQQHCAKQPHTDSFPGERNRARISVVCSHSRASLSSCLRPARVSL